MIFQREIVLKAKPRGFHLVDMEILSKLTELKNISIGIANIFIKHTAASLAINDNTDPSVRSDMEIFFVKAVPESEAKY